MGNYPSTHTIKKPVTVIHRMVSQDTSKSLVTVHTCLLYTSPSPRDLSTSRMPSSA